MLRTKSLISFICLVAGLFLLSDAAIAQTETQEVGEATAGENAALAEIRLVTAQDLEELIGQLDEKWVEYEKQLQSVLRTRLIEEKEFVARVILLVQKEQVPKKLLDSAWLWVRDKRPGTRYPFVYFERVLRLEAEKAKILLPAFDRRLYGDREAMRQRMEQQRLRRR